MLMHEHEEFITGMVEAIGNGCRRAVNRDNKPWWQALMSIAVIIILVETESGYINIPPDFKKRSSKITFNRMSAMIKLSESLDAHA
jgi:hypothetical protein